MPLTAQTGKRVDLNCIINKGELICLPKIEDNGYRILKGWIGVPKVIRRREFAALVSQN